MAHAGDRRRLFLPLALGLLAGCGSGNEPSATVTLAEAGWSFGFCLGPCNGTLDVEGTNVSYRVTSREGDAVLAQAGGALTASGSERLGQLLAALPGTLDEQYGCPDCADAGAAYVVVERDGVPHTSTYEYPNPPPELSALDAFVRGVTDALGRCQSTAEVAVVGPCVPLPG